MFKTTFPKHRDIRSFVIRSGRMTNSQKAAFKEHMDKWSLSVDGPKIDSSNTFGNTNPLILEIGFGMGDSLAAMALNEPEHNFIGIEVHQAGVGKLLRLVEENKICNIRVFCHDAIQALEQKIASHSLDRVNIYFPDPWPKKRHHKRRLIQEKFLTLLHSRMKPQGLLHIATDWMPYAEHILEVTASSHCFKNIAGKQLFVSAAEYGRPETKFERRGLGLGHSIRDMVFKAA